MIFTATEIDGAWLIATERRSDERGYLTRTYCANEFAAHGLCTHWVQCSTVFSHKSGTLRGMHYQRPPNEEIKLVRCTSGAIFDVIVDLRPTSPTYGRWYGTYLDAASQQMIYIPPGVAHGLQTMSDGTEVLYMMSSFYEPSAADGVRWDDPAFGIEWPDTPTSRTISERDKQWPDFRL